MRGEVRAGVRGEVRAEVRGEVRAEVRAGDYPSHLVAPLKCQAQEIGVPRSVC